uniref:Uncharacterized protein n=1 Tax=Sphaerodactylus townsendi TaxID=933632 RepID=A0ACB8ERB0_9SAUR
MSGRGRCTERDARTPRRCWRAGRGRGEEEPLAQTGSGPRDCRNGPRGGLDSSRGQSARLRTSHRPIRGGLVGGVADGSGSAGGCNSRRSLDAQADSRGGRVGAKPQGLETPPRAGSLSGPGRVQQPAAELNVGQGSPKQLGQGREMSFLGPLSSLSAWRNISNVRTIK